MRKIYVMKANGQDDDFGGDGDLDTTFDPIILKECDRPEDVINNWMSDNFEKFEPNLSRSEIETDSYQQDEDGFGVIYVARCSYATHCSHIAGFKLIEE